MGGLGEGVPAAAERVTEGLADPLRLAVPRGDCEVVLLRLGQGEAVRWAVDEALVLGLGVGMGEVEAVVEAVAGRVAWAVRVMGEAVRAGESEGVVVPLTVGLSGGGAESVGLRVCVLLVRGEALLTPVGLWLGQGRGVEVEQGEAVALAEAAGVGEVEASAVPVAGPVVEGEALGVAQEELLAPRA